jgi:hypothetical protein
MSIPQHKKQGWQERFPDNYSVCEALTFRQCLEKYGQDARATQFYPPYLSGMRSNSQSSIYPATFGCGASIQNRLVCWKCRGFGGPGLGRNRVRDGDTPAQIPATPGESSHAAILINKRIE